MNEAAKNVAETVSADASRIWPDDVLAAFFRAVSSRDLWKWLREDEQFALLQEIARGFQQSPKALAQPLVRSRFKSHLTRETATRDNLQKWWCDNAGKDVCEAIALIENDETWQEKTTQWTQQFGRDALILATFFDARFSLNESEIEAKAANNLRVIPSEVEETAKDSSTSRGMTQIADRVLDSAENARDDSQLKRENETLKNRAQNAENMALQARRESEKLQSETKRLQRENDQQKHLFDKRENDLQLKIEEAQKLGEREARRARQSEKQLEEQSAEIKRLKRLVRQSQLLQEESRRQIALLNAQIEELQPRPVEPKVEIAPPISVSAKVIKPKKPPRAPKPLFGRDEVFSWKNGAREVAVSPREIAQRVDKNDETFVANLSRELEILREENPDLAKRFRSSVRQLGRYYNRVLDGATSRVLVDASNVARYEKDARGRGQFGHLLAMRDELRRYDCFPILFFADASLVYNIDEPDELQQMARRGELEIVNAGTEADDILARLARQSGARVVTNDRNFHGRVAPAWEPSRIAFHIRDGIVVLDDMD